jgi:hypothetical protein
MMPKLTFRDLSHVFNDLTFLLKEPPAAVWQKSLELEPKIVRFRQEILKQSISSRLVFAITVRKEEKN